METGRFAVQLTLYTQHTQQPCYGPLSATTWVSKYQKKHSPTHHPDHHPIFISFFHLPQSIACSLFKLCAWQSFCTISLHVLFGLPLGWSPPPHIPYIYSPNQCLLVAAHAIPSQPVLLLYQYYIIYFYFSQLLTWNFVFCLNITHPSDHSHLCSLKCHLIFFPDRPSLTSV